MSKLLTYSLRSLWVRRTTTLATAFGIALVVFVLCASRMLAWGMRKTMSSAGTADQALVMQHDAWAEVGSRMDQSALGQVAAAPGVKRDAAGQPLVTAEVVAHLLVNSTSGKRISTLQVRGVSPNVFELRPEAVMVSGRKLTPGTDEAIVGQGLAGRFEGLGTGDSFELSANRKVTIVGVFATGGSSHESEVWTDLETARSAFAFGASLSSVTAQLESEAAYDVFAEPLTRDKQQGLSVTRESAYYEKVSGGLADVISLLGILETSIFSLGAILGAMLTMYAAVAQRGREIGVLLALGFGRLQIMSAFVAESIALALAGALFGIGLSLLTPLLDFSTTNFATGQEVLFRFVPKLDILLISLLVGGAVGAVGGILPAARAARTSPARAMRA